MGITKHNQVEVVCLQVQLEALHARMIFSVHPLINNTTQADVIEQHFVKDHKSQDSKLGLLFVFFLLPHLLLRRRET